MLGMGGDPAGARACAVDMVREWERHENFTLYEDALPVLGELRERGIRIGLVTNGQRDLDEFVPAPPPARRRNGRLEGARPDQAASVDLRRGAAPTRGRTRRLGDGRGLLRGRHPEVRGRSGCARSSSTATAACAPTSRIRIDTLLALPAALGLAR